MVRRLVIPAVLLLVMLLLSLRVDQVRGYRALPVYACLAWDVSSPLAADVLFVGSSRSGAAIDPVYIQQQLGAAGREQTVYRINSHGPDLAFYWLMARQYLAHNPPPAHVFVELMIDTRSGETYYREHWGRAAGAPYLQPKSIMMGRVSHYHELLQALAPGAGQLPLRRAYISTIEYAATKYVTALYHLMIRPGDVFAGTRDSCTENTDWKRSAGRWLHGSLPTESAEPQLLDDALKHSDDFRQAVDALVPLSIDSASRDYEVQMLNAIANLFLEAGSKRVGFYHLPSYSAVPVDARQRDAVRQRFPDVPVTFLEDLFAQPGNADMAEMFKDPHHLSQSGGQRVSSYFAERVGQTGD